MRDAVHVSIEVPAAPAEAFAIFTREVDLWWDRSRVYRMAPDSFLRFEPEVGGRFVEVRTDGRTRTIGRIEAWEPGVRLGFEWRGVNFAPDQVTHVEVLFEGVPEGTRVTVHHRGWASLPADHPARHRQAPDVFIQAHSRWWAQLLVLYKQRGTR